MSEVEVDGEPVAKADLAGEEETFRDFVLVSAEGEVDSDYLTGAISLDGDIPCKVAVAAISEVQDRLLVAVPSSVWRKPGKRVLPPGSLIKATAVAVAGCVESNRDEAVGGVEVTIWIGFLNPDLEAKVSVRGEDLLGAYSPVPGRRFRGTMPAMGRSSPCSGRKVFFSECSLAECDRWGSNHGNALGKLEQSLARLEQLLLQGQKVPPAKPPAPNVPKPSILKAPSIRERRRWIARWLSRSRSWSCPGRPSRGDFRGASGCNVTPSSEATRYERAAKRGGSRGK